MEIDEFRFQILFNIKKLVMYYELRTRYDLSIKCNASWTDFRSHELTLRVTGANYWTSITKLAEPPKLFNLFLRVKLPYFA